MHTLLIDDDPITAFLTKRVLVYEGLSDTAASFQSPTDALAFLLRQIPANLVLQVILLDLNMPVVSGWDFLDLLKPQELQLQGQCIVYLLTSSMAPADELRAKKYPLVAGVLLKPLDHRKIQQIRAHVLPAALRATPPRGAQNLTQLFLSITICFLVPESALLLFPSVTPMLASREASPDKARLIERLLARDEQALRLLHARYAKSVLGVVLRLVRDETLAEDVLQEAWLKAWPSFASYDTGRGRLFRLLTRMCSNHAGDVMRSPRYRFHRQSRSLESAGAVRVSAPASFKPAHFGVRELAGQLKPRQRENIDLLYFGGCTQVEAAKALGIPLATVKTRARATVQALAVLACLGPVPLLRTGSA